MMGCPVIHTPKNTLELRGKKPRNSSPALVSGTLWPAYDEEEMTHMK